MPKQRGRKSKSDVLKKKMELAKKEQVDRFTKIAAPSGLLNGLNPGIINHVRNKKQVHSIIEALVRSEKLEHGDETRQESRPKNEAKEICSNSDSGMHQFRYSQACGVSHSSYVVEGDALALKLSASTKEDSSTYSNDESNVSSISSLSVRGVYLKRIYNLTLFTFTLKRSKKANDTSVYMNALSGLSAASVASQWLELLHQDIKGRLSALRQSKKRVRAVIAAELPFLISKEFPSNQENDPCIMKNLPDGLTNDVISSMHRTRWSTLFDQMDKALSEEERQLARMRGDYSLSYLGS